MSIQVDFTFDDKTYRHYMNGFMTVLHCHHYLCLTTQMAEDFDDLGGTRILRETAEDTIRPILNSYYQKYQQVTVEDRLRTGAEYYSIMGMGKMKLKVNQNGGTVVLSHSHLDQGWIKKWGKYHKPINHFTRGYIAAMFGAAFETPPRNFQVTEVSSIVTGNETCQYNVERVGANISKEANHDSFTG